MAVATVQWLECLPYLQPEILLNLLVSVYVNYVLQVYSKLVNCGANNCGEAFPSNWMGNVRNTTSFRSKTTYPVSMHMALSGVCLSSNVEQQICGEQDCQIDWRQWAD